MLGLIRGARVGTLTCTPLMATSPLRSSKVVWSFGTRTALMPLPHAARLDRRGTARSSPTISRTSGVGNPSSTSLLDSSLSRRRSLRLTPSERRCWELRTEVSCRSLLSSLDAAEPYVAGFMANWIQGHNDVTKFKAIVCHDGGESGTKVERRQRN